LVAFREPAELNRPKDLAAQLPPRTEAALVALERPADHQAGLAGAEEASVPRKAPAALRLQFLAHPVQDRAVAAHAHLKVGEGEEPRSQRDPVWEAQVQ
jgi:hypothetical protein